MTMRFMNSKKTWMLSSLFALMMAGSSLMGAETEGKEVKPEIRSSKTPIVQVANPASVRLQVDVARDGGTVEGASTIGERANASVQEAADAVYAAGNTSREFLAEQGREYLGRPGEAAGQLVGGVAQGVTALGGALTQGAGYVAEGATDATVWTYDNALKPVANAVSDGVEGAWDWSGEQLKKVGNFFGGLFSSEEVIAQEQSRPEQQPEAEALDTPIPEEDMDLEQENEVPSAGDAVVETVDNAADAVYDAGSTTREFLAEQGREYLGPVGEGIGNFAGGIVQTGTGLAGLATQGAGRIAGVATDVHNFMNENVYQPVADAFTPSETTAEPTERAQETTAPAVQQAEVVPEVQAEQPTAEEGPNWFERNIVNPVVDGVEDVHNFMNENVYQPTGDFVTETVPQAVEDVHNFMNENVYQPVADAFTPSETSAEPTEQGQETTAPEVQQPQVDVSAEDDLSEIWGGTKNFFTEKIPQAVEDTHNFMNENVYQPVADAFTPSETSAEPTEQGQENTSEVHGSQPSLWERFTGLFKSKAEDNSVQTQKKAESDSQSTQPKETTVLEGVGTFVEDTHKTMTDKVYRPIGQFVEDTHQTMTGKVYKPTGQFVEEAYNKTVDGVKGLFETKEIDMTKLTEFLKAKGLSDADIQIAVSLAQGKKKF